jgi:predicted metal-dependent phosphoesterase TrpH
VAVVDHIWVREVEAALKEAARDVITLEIGDEIAAQLEER